MQEWHDGLDGIAKFVRCAGAWGASGHSCIILSVYRRITVCRWMSRLSTNCWLWKCCVHVRSGLCVHTLRVARTVSMATHFSCVCTHAWLKDVKKVCDCLRMSYLHISPSSFWCFTVFVCSVLTFSSWSTWLVCGFWHLFERFPPKDRGACALRQRWRGVRLPGQVRPPHIMRHQLQPKESTTTWIWRVCWVNLCNVTASSVLFLSPTERAAPWMSILRSLTQSV